MKRKSINAATTRIIATVAVFGVCLTALLLNFNGCVNMLRRLTVMSISTVIPTGINSDAIISSHRVNSEETTESSEGTESSSEMSAEETTLTVSDDLQESFSGTPEDIKKVMKEYERKNKKAEEDGKITEQTYKSSGVTDSYGVVKVKNTNDTDIDIKALLKEKADLSVTEEGARPAVLLFHTHTTETYEILDRGFYAVGHSTRSNNEAVNMVRVGVAVKEELEKAGFRVIHDTTIFDYKYSGAYGRSRTAIEKHLAENPDIQVVLDIHRDAIQLNDGTKIKPVADIDGKKCAQIMIISGCQEKGNGISGFEEWRYNLVFALHLQKKLEELFPGITRPLYFCPRKYNMDTSHCSVLLEMGSDANTLEEAAYSGKCLGKALADMMKEMLQDKA